MNSLPSFSPVLQHSPSLKNLTSSNTLPGSNGKVDAQATLANRLADKLGLGAGALSGKSEDFTPDKVADRILGFVEQRLKSEAAAGADPAKLQSLLDQAREGVEKGFAEARKILDGMGVLQGKVAENIDATYDKIQSGLAGLADSLASTTPTTNTGSSAVAAYSERFSARADTFDMQVTTRDGDRLSISIASASASWSKTSVAAASNANGSAAIASSESGTLQIGGWQVKVEGELDAEERAALGDLFSQVQDLSSKFYSGDLEGAFDRAMQLDMDGSQLASMSLHLTQTSVRQATDAYSSVAQQGGQAASAVNDNLIDYARSLLDALSTAGDVSDDAKTTLEQLLDGGFSLDNRFSDEQLDKAKALNQRLLEGLQGLLPADEASAS
ncbi:DUF5610 domain-containing protein [Aquipseudomonas ullengensis]|uniref:DUF5610 domain-containing protein n=1 Tax=Aquipseudomonas ullengensis TaxID=2759166 RepID=A0A7W4QAH7_9GAMM|nr:DUF5610 domain-containing protein [Pseudomonas ullengensis]MBB2495857.1 DUF5610 domain-containing protein [Pseudomonas ullengensis]